MLSHPLSKEEYRNIVNHLRDTYLANILLHYIPPDGCGKHFIRIWTDGEKELSREPLFTDELCESYDFINIFKERGTPELVEGIPVLVRVSRVVASGLSRNQLESMVYEVSQMVLFSMGHESELSKISSQKSNRLYI